METVHLLTCRISRRQRRLRPLRAQTPARTRPLMAPSLGARRGEAAGSWVTVRVRADDITGALQDARLARHPAHYCPVARALCRALAVPLGWVTIGPSNVDCEAWQGYGPVEGILPPQVTAAIDRFDRGRVMQPFAFQVQLQPWGGRAAADPGAAWRPMG